jgi:hypothetical protein
LYDHFLPFPDTTRPDRPGSSFPNDRIRKLDQI